MGLYSGEFISGSLQYANTQSADVAMIKAFMVSFYLMCNPVLQIWKVNILKHRSSHQRCSTTGVFPQACNLTKKETLPQVFSHELCKICKKTFFTEHFRAATSVNICLQEQMKEMFKQNNVNRKTATHLDCSDTYNVMQKTIYQ